MKTRMSTHIQTHRAILPSMICGQGVQYPFPLSLTPRLFNLHVTLMEDS